MDNTVVHTPETEIRAPELLTVSPSPHIKSGVTTRSVMGDVLIALAPACVWSVVVFGFRALALILLSTLLCVGFEWLTQTILRRPVTVRDLSAAVTGVLLAMNLPVTLPYWMLIPGALFAIVVVKQLFGGIGKNFLNPALAARVFLLSAWPGQMTYFTAPMEWVSPFRAADAVASATPLASLSTESASILDLFLGRVGGSLGEVSALMLILGGAYLIVRRVITWHIPVSYIGTVALLALIFPRVGAGIEGMLFELLAGGLMLGAIFMATDYVTSPITAWGRVIYGVGCGLLTVFIRYLGGYPEGVSFSILVMNTLVWYLDRATKPRVFGGGKHGKA